MNTLIGVAVVLIRNFDSYHRFRKWSTPCLLQLLTLSKMEEMDMI